MQKSKKIPFEFVKREEKIFKNKQTLKISYVPDQLPGREKEIEKLQWRLKDALKGETPLNIFIYGHPGVGKTACCKKVLRDLHEKIVELKISNVRTIYINCATAHTECKILEEIINFFSKNKLAPRGGGRGDYYSFFSKILDDLGGIFILVLDEVDKLIPAHESLLYNLTRANDNILSKAEISLIGISNNLTSFDKLDPRIKSSMCQREIIINPYNATQLEKILDQRAKKAFNKNVVEMGTIQLCAALTAREYGDARKAIDLLREAGELAEMEGKKRIETVDVKMAEGELEKSRVKEIIKGLPLQKKIVLLSILQLTKEEGETIVGEAYESYKKITQDSALSLITYRRFRYIIEELDMMGICNTRIMARGRYGRTTKIQLGVPSGDVESALSKDEILAPLVTQKPKTSFF